MGSWSYIARMRISVFGSSARICRVTSMPAIDPVQRASNDSDIGLALDGRPGGLSPSTAMATTSQLDWDSTILRRPVPTISWASAIKMRTAATSVPQGEQLEVYPFH